MQYLLDNMHRPCCHPWPFAKQSAGYPHLMSGGRLTLASRLVCSITHGEPPDKNSVARHSCGKGHLGCFSAGCVMWGTPKQNTQDAIAHGTLARGERVGTSKLRRPQVEEILLLCGTIPQTEIAAMFGVSQSMISNINLRKSWA